MAKKKKQRPKRVNGEGSYFPLPNGKWRAVVTVGIVDGKQRRKTKTVASQRDAIAAIPELRLEAANGSALTSSPVGDEVTVVEYLEKWLHLIKKNRAENTYASYKIACDTHIIPHLGGLTLRKLRPLDVQEWVSESLRDAKPRAAQNAFVVLRAALKKAVELEQIPSNPCNVIEKPKHSRESIFPFTLEETKQILDATESDPYHALYGLAFSTGMRSGELYGLQWKNVDLNAGTLRVCRQATEISGRVVACSPKSNAGHRTIELTPKVIESLKLRRALTAGDKRSSRVAEVFCTTQGKYMRRSGWRKRHWEPLLKRLKLQYRGFHHARHTYATLALSAGVPVAVVSQILGHSKPSVTWDIYSHVLETQQKEARDTMSKLFD